MVIYLIKSIYILYMKTKIYILALILILIIILSALCASYERVTEGMLPSDNPAMSDPAMIAKVPVLSNAILADLLGNFFNIVKRNEHYLVFVYNQMYSQDMIDCSLNLESCSSIIINDNVVLPFDRNEILQSCCPESPIPDNTDKVSPLVGNTIQENLERLMPYILKHEQLLIIFNAQLKTTYIPSNDLLNVIEGTDPGRLVLKQQLEYIQNLEPVRSTEWVECDTNILRQEIEELKNSLSQFDSDGQRDIRREIQDRTKRIIFLESENLKNNIKCNTNPTYDEPVISEAEFQSKRQMLTLYYLYHILSNQNSGIQSLEQTLQIELEYTLPFEMSDTAELQQSLFNM